MLLLAGGTALGQGITILAAPILTRLYSPADFGVLVVYAAILSSVVGIASLRYHLAVPAADNQETVAALAVICTLITLGLAVVFGLGLWRFGPNLVAWTQSPTLASYLWLLPLSFLGAGMYQILNTWAIRDNQFSRLARTRLGQGAGLVLTQIGLGLIHHGPAGLLIGDAVGRACGSLSLGRLAWRTHHAMIRRLTLAGLLQAAARYRRFPLISGPSALAANVRGQVPAFLLAAFYGGLVVGWFGLGQRLLTVTFYLVASSVGDVYFNESARIVREDPARLMDLYWRTLRRTAVVALPLLGTLAIVAPWVFGPLFGDEWAEAGRYVRILAVVAAFDVLSRGVGSTLSIIERQDLDLVTDVVGIVLVSGALIAGGTLGASPTTTLIFYSIAGSVAGLVYLGVVWYAIRQTINKTAVSSDGED